MKRVAVLALALVLASALFALFAQSERADAEVALVNSNHLVVIPMENKSYAQIVGNPNAPYINNTIIAGGSLFTKYYSATHPSLPDYLVLTSGDYQGCVTDTCLANSITSENIFHELAGNWKVYAENMPSNCFRANKSPYLARHNPAVYYTNLDATGGDGTCQTRDVPSSELATDIAANALPRYAWYVPNAYNDMHTEKKTAPVCNLGNTLQNQICQGDTWLSQKLPALISNGGLNDVTVLLVFDEGVGNAGGAGQVLLVEYGAGVTPGTVNSPFNHYGLVNAMADVVGVPRLGPAVPGL